MYWLWKHCLLLSILPGDKRILIHIEKPCRSRTCLVRLAGPCPAVPAPVQLVSVQLYLPLSSCTCPAGSCPAGSLSSWLIPAGVYEPANSHRNAAYSQQEGESQSRVPVNAASVHLLSPRVVDSRV